MFLTTIAIVVTIATRIQILRNQVRKINPDLIQKLGMLMYNAHALLPDAGTAFDTVQLPCKELVEVIQVSLGPLDAGACHERREALLVDTDRVFDETEVDEGNLEDV